MKRLLSVVLTVAVLFMTCVMPVSAAECLILLKVII